MKKAHKITFRIHCLYGALRLSAFIFDMFVFYHAKNLKLIQDEDEHEHKEESSEEPKDEKLKLPEARFVPASPKSQQHKRSASREIRLIFDDDEQKGDQARRHSSDYMVGEISNVTSNGVV
jgi:hypothetical protein